MDITQTKSAAMLAVLHMAARFAPTSHPILLLGETGSGKTEMAHYIHSRSPRADAELIEVNCGGLSDTLIDSQLFGHERGSFTGASSAHGGHFERADGGTIFLDEVGELPLEAQRKLLTVLEDGRIQRLGSSRVRRVDVRVVAATNRDLADEVRRGRFREDLYYRLRILDLVLPPLRDRREDIPLMILGWSLGVRPEAVDGFARAQYDWPGNIRELMNTARKAAVLEWGADDVIGALTSPPQSSAREEVVLGLAARPEGVKRADVAAVLRCDETNASRILTRLLSRGLVARVSRGVYRLVSVTLSDTNTDTSPEPCGNTHDARCEPLLQGSMAGHK